MTNNAGNQYLQQSAMTASPGELTLMLYDGCIKHLKLSKVRIDEKDYMKCNESLQKSQAIIAELMITLDMRYDVSKQMYQLYDFVINSLTEANVKKDKAKIDEVIGIVSEMRDTWQQAVIIDRQQKSGAATAAPQGSPSRSYGA